MNAQHLNKEVWYMYILCGWIIIRIALCESWYKLSTDVSFSEQ